MLKLSTTISTTLVDSLSRIAAVFLRQSLSSNAVTRNLKCDRSDNKGREMRENPNAEGMTRVSGHVCSCTRTKQWEKKWCSASRCQSKVPRGCVWAYVEETVYDLRFDDYHHHSTSSSYSRHLLRFHAVMSEALKPPQINTEDPGAHELSESDDHFSSADEGSSEPNRLSSPASPIPTTRVERVDDQPAHGEVPNTAAYDMRRQDAVPDEIEVVPEGARSRSGTRGRTMSNLSISSRPQTPGGSPIPKTVVDRVDDKPAHGEVEGTLAKEMRSADAAPDEVRKAPDEARNGRLDGR
nr:hypothetical protein CFP56_72779 [Quercus suber]